MRMAIVACLLLACETAAAQAAFPGPSSEDLEARARWLEHLFPTPEEAAKGLIREIVRLGFASAPASCLWADLGSESEDLWHFQVRFNRERCPGSPELTLVGNFAVVKYSDVLLWETPEGHYASLDRHADWAPDPRSP